MITRRQRSALVTAAVAAIVVAALASNGAYFSQSWGWVALAFLVPSTVLVILGSVTVPGRLRIAFVVLTGALGVWIALSAIWSISPSASAREVERMLAYVSVALAVALVLRRGDGPAVATGTLIGATAITSYGLATRLLPDRFASEQDLFNAYRLAEPLGYWNAFGLVAAIATILAVGTIAHARRAGAAMLAGAALPVLSMSLYFSFSRGSLLALAFGLVALVAVDPRRIAVLWSLVAVSAPCALGVFLASRQDALTTDQTTELAATTAGHRLAWLLVLLVPCSAILALLAGAVARRVRVGRRGRRAAAAVLAAAAAAVVAVSLVAVGGPATALEELRDRFRAPPGPGSSLNDRLFSLTGSGRHESIGLAWDNARERPLGGNGAGTFEYQWYEGRPPEPVVPQVRDAHSLYVETFNELGVVGVVLLVSMLALPAVAALRARRSRFVAPALGAYAAWFSAAALDWHWEMVGLTLTALLAAAVCLVSAERRAGAGVSSSTGLMLVGLTGVLSVCAVWSLVGNQALQAGTDALSDRDWAEARDHGVRARSLLAWSHEPDLVVGRAEAGLGNREASLQAFRAAVEKDPRNWLAWLYVAQVERGSARDTAYDRVRELNPREEDLPGE